MYCGNGSAVVMHDSARVRCTLVCVFFFQAEDGIRDLVRSRGLGDVYKRQAILKAAMNAGGGGTTPRTLCLRPAPHRAARVLPGLSLIHI